MVKDRNRRLYRCTGNVFSKRLRIYDGRNGRPWALKEAFRRW